MPSHKSVIQKKTGVREDLAASCANEQPSVTNQSALGIRSLSRRGFIGRVGGATAAAWTASAISLSPVLGSKSVKAEAATILGRQRAIEAYDLRKEAALAEYHAQQRYLHDGRGVSAFVHVDLLFQAYFMGLLWLLRNANFNVGNPYNTSQTQIGFGTFGGPHITSLLAEVSGYALRAQWFQKFWVHRALRPEAYGGLVHYTKTAAASYPVHADVMNSQALAGRFAKKNVTYIL